MFAVKLICAISLFLVEANAGILGHAALGEPLAYAQSPYLPYAPDPHFLHKTLLPAPYFSPPIVKAPLPFAYAAPVGFPSPVGFPAPVGFAAPFGYSAPVLKTALPAIPVGYGTPFVKAYSPFGFHGAPIIKAAPYHAHFAKTIVPAALAPAPIVKAFPGFAAHYDYPHHHHHHDHIFA